MRYYKTNSGFNLLELVVVIVIIGILAILAIPQFTINKERSLGNEAKASLKLIATAEKIYRLEASGYYPLDGDPADIAGINSNLRLSLNENNWNYNITGGTGAFRANALRIGAGGYLDCQYYTNSTIADQEPLPNASCP